MVKKRVPNFIKISRLTTKDIREKKIINTLTPPLSPTRSILEHKLFTFKRVEKCGTYIQKHPV